VNLSIYFGTTVLCDAKLFTMAGETSSSSSTTVLRQPSSSTTTKTTTTISSAPALAEQPKPNYYSTLPPPTAEDPYPGFYLLPSGEWAAKEPEQWAQWAQINGWTTTSSQNMYGQEAPKGFDQAEVANATEVKPQKPLPPEQRQAAKPKPPKVCFCPLFFCRQ
jgi:hypothetical protein